MKKGRLLNSEINYVISRMGHTDGLTIGDCGLPIPEGVKRIDLALEKNIPGFMDTLKAVLTELRVEQVIVAKEMKEKSAPLYEQVKELIKQTEQEENIQIEIIEVSHEVFKEQTAGTKAVIRTGEQTPYANIILKSGVVF
ncbi:MAG: D-ribose pyranase [Bacillota bacterium]